MRFSSIDALIKSAESHLDSTGSHETEVEAYLVQYLLVRVWAEYETRITAMVRIRCQRTRDAHIREFATTSAGKVCRRIAISDIKGILARFGGNYKTSFEEVLGSNTTTQTAWDNLHINRNAVAHNNGSVQMSFSDLKRDYNNSLNVLEALRSALCLRSGEIGNLS